jgi:GT2 family glycosyltransferase
LVIAPNIVTLEGRRQNPHVIANVPILELIKARIYFSNYYVAQASSLINGALRWLRRKIRSGSINLRPAPEPGRMKIKRGIGACYVLTPYFFHHHQRLDDRVFLWGEEALLSHQVESVGGTTLYDPFIKITHCESASVRFIDKRERYEIVRTSYKIYRPHL